MRKRIAIAPMMNWTDRHYRYLMRLITKNTILYTEMVHTQAILNGNKNYLLDFHPLEHPLILQLGGSNPIELAKCSQIAQQWGYDGVNLNVGCPSERVQSGQFGACLMLEPFLVARCIAAMKEACTIPISVKTRIGIDTFDSYEFFREFVSTVSKSGCHHFIIHARKAWLKGLSPKQNREIPPLCYDYVYDLKKDFPHLEILINGGIQTLENIKEHLTYVDGVMLGRVAYHHPLLFFDIEKEIFGNQQQNAIQTILENYVCYMNEEIKRGVPIALMARHVLNLVQGIPNAKIWRRNITQRMPTEKTSDFILNEFKAYSN